MKNPPRWLPTWLSSYQRGQLPGDLTAGLIVTVMLIPQSLAYAMLAGLPPEVGLYASILPLLAYAALGSSMTLAVGPVAVASLMTASALQPLATPGSPEYVALAIALALLSGVMLLVFGFLRLGFLAQLLSHPVISGFITGSALLIAIGQTRHLLGLPAGGDHAIGQVWHLLTHLPQVEWVTASIGLGAVALLLLMRRLLGTHLLGKLAPMAVVILGTVAVAFWQLDQSAGVRIVGEVPAGLPMLGLSLPGWNATLALLLPALLISLVGFVESVSVAQSLALKRRQRIEPNKELLGLGAANVASALSGGYPVTGGFARSVVNFAAGAQTPLAGVISAALMAGVLLGLTGWFHYLPHAVLAATIVVAVLQLVDFQTLRQAWRYDRADALAFAATAAGVLLLGVEAGILAGVALSLGVLVWRSSRPHIAVIGRVPGTEHFRNVLRHKVETRPGLLALRVDENLFFANAALVEQHIEGLL
ncbi:MAG: sulfate permease, partial [Burkholderiaceae bacterium]|nr:sulfate permease [Burkholderiaceae bacterium]